MEIGSSLGVVRESIAEITDRQVVDFGINVRLLKQLSCVKIDFVLNEGYCPGLRRSNSLVLPVDAY
jgi:hypothetical protein